jgi:hypothetical protein
LRVESPISEQLLGKSRLRTGFPVWAFLSTIDSHLSTA